jgi:hypothetical protein
MKNILCLAVAGSAVVSLVGCGSTLPVVFADKTVLGVDISGSEQGADLSLGFKTRSLSIVPVAVRQKDAAGNVTGITLIEGKDVTKGEIKDSFSTFGNFTVDTGVKGASASVGLGRFFATGVAAQKLAERLGDAMVETAKRTPLRANPGAAPPN